MTCKACKERNRQLREALLKKRIGEASKQAFLGAAEMAGLKKKTGYKAHDS